MPDLTKFKGHTPGPWRYEDGHVVGLGGARDIANVRDILSHIQGHDTQATRHSDGRLLAAAPELLDELAAARAEARRLRGMILAFATGQRWCHVSWQREPHIAPLFEEAARGTDVYGLAALDD